MLKKKSILFLAAALVFAACSDPYTYTGPVHQNPADTTSVKPGPDTPTPPDPVEVTLIDPFTEEFGSRTAENVVFSLDTAKPDFRYFSGFPSLTLGEVDVLLLRLNPSDPSGVGAVVSARGFVEEGSVSVRVRLPDITSVQPKLSAAFELALCAPDGTDAATLSLPLAQPTKVSVAVGDDIRTLTPGITGFKSSSQFYIYGIDRTSSAITFWIRANQTTEEVVLAEFTEGLPSGPLRPVIRFFHTSPAALYPYELEIDWMSYTPFDKYNPYLKK